MSITVEQLEDEIARQKGLIERADLARRLFKNRDFRKLIQEEFMVNECAQYAQASADSALPAENRADALAIAQSAGYLKRWLSIVCQMGTLAAQQMPSYERELAEARTNPDDAEDEDVG